MWLLASWSVRSLLDCENVVETARQCTEVGPFDDTKIDQVTKELERKGIRLTVTIGGAFP